MEFSIKYRGGFRLHVETDGTIYIMIATIDLPGKSMKFKVPVTMRFEALDGNMLIRTNPLPSAQIW